MKWKLGVVGVAVASLLLTGCTGDGGPQGAEEAELAIDGHFTMGMYGDLGTLNPTLNVSSAIRQLTPIAYDNLLHFDEDGTPHPWLAESWEDSLDSVSYVLKDGILCSDGTTLTASTVAANFEFIDDEENGSPLRGALLPVGITAVADDATRTVTLNFDDPGSFLLYQTGTLNILCQAAIDDPSSIEASTNGTGMFTLTEALAGDSYEFDRRDVYDWGFDDTTADTPGVPKTLTIRVFNNESTLANSILKGEVNAGQVTGPDVDRLVAANLDSTGSELLQGQFWFNQTEGNPTAEREVREALIRAVDLGDLAAVHTGGRGHLATSALSHIPRPCVYNTMSSVPSFDIDAAATLLEDSGWVSGADGVRVKDGQRLEIGLVYDNSMDGVKAAAELTQTQWAELGAEVTLIGGDDGFVIGTSLGEDRHAWQVSWVPVIADLPTIMTPLISGPSAPEGLNLAGLDHPDYVNLISEASSIAGADSCDIWQAAEEALITDLFTVPFAAAENSVFYNGAFTVVESPTPVGPTIRVTK